MNKHQKLVQQQFLNDEETVIKRLKKIYSVSLNDITKKAAQLQDDIDELDTLAKLPISDEEKEIILSRRRAKVYQKKYQESLAKQVDEVLDKMQVKQFTTVSEYLTECYDNGFVGTMFDLQGQGIPLCFPLDQEQMVRAVQLDSKISKGLYSKLGEDVSILKRKISAQVSRGISTGMSYQQVAQQLAGTTNIGFNNAVRIARTEGHRIQCQAGMDASYKAKEKGADVLKQWDATMDSRTRESHVAVDGEIRELDEKFSNGLMFPGDPSGGAAEVINCRCALLQRARWALDDDELEALKKKAEYYGIDKTDNFNEFKDKYLKAAESELPVTPKKQYLTEKKLQQLVDDADMQLAQLEEAFKNESGGWTYDEAINDFGSLDGLTDGDNLKALETLKKQMDDIAAQKTEWEEKLNAKLVAKETKKLKKEQMALQKQLDAFDDTETFGGIWYGQDDITVKDWQAKQPSIQKKIDYYEEHIKNASLYGHSQADIDKFNDLLAKTKDFDKKGQEYWNVKNSLTKVDSDLTKLTNNGIISAKNAGDAFSQERKDAALWFDKDHGGFREADKYFDPPAKAIHGAATRQEQNGFYTYTEGSGGHNRPLAGFQKPWSKSGTGWEEEFYVGPKKVWIDFEGKGDQIRGLTTLIQKSTYADDIWLQSGQNFQTLEGFLGLPYGTLRRMSDSDLQQFVGRKNVIYNFISTAVNEGGGGCFNGKPMKLNIYAPKGSQMLYASDVGAYGKGENEMILQRGGTYRITKIYWGTDDTDYGTRKIFVDMEIHPEAGYDLFQQDPSEWKGSRKNYKS